MEGENSRMGSYLDENYKRIVMSAERKLFRCCKTMSTKELRNHYPPCRKRHSYMDEFTFDEWRELYYGVLIADIQKRHPEKIMEAFMCAESWRR